MINQQESMTAKLCAFTRAWHSNKAKDKIYDDYLAYDLMGKEEYEYVYRSIQEDFKTDPTVYAKKDVEHFVNTYLTPIVLPRVKFIKERLTKFQETHKHIQYVICGAGSDTFSFRNSNPNIEVFEVDHPVTQFYKRKRIAELEWNIPNNVHFVPVDFQKDKLSEKLLEHGFAIEKPTFFSILGVTYYLTLPVFTDTLQQIATISSKDSMVAFDFPQKQEKKSRLMEELEDMTHRLGETMQGGYTCNEIQQVLQTLGFVTDALLSPDRIQKLYLTNQDDAVHAFDAIHFLSAIQQKL